MSRIGDFFEVSGNGGETAADTDIVIAGDASRVKYIGSKMTAGTSPSMATQTCMSVAG